MQCPNCGSISLKVVDTNREIQSVMRRRECESCLIRFNTCEIVADKRYSLEGSSDLGDIEQRVLNQLLLRQHRQLATLADEIEPFYTDEYVDELLPDEEIQDLLTLFNLNDDRGERE